jgi:tight adherence protein B
MSPALDRWRRLAPALGIALLVAGWAAGPAGAQVDGATERLVLRVVDSTDEQVEVVLSYSGGVDALDDLVIRENGEPVDFEVAPLPEDGDAQVDVLFVVDTSASTDANAMLSETKDALRAFFADLPAGSRAAVVAVGSASQRLQGLTDDRARLETAVDQLTPSGEGALFSGVVQAADLARRRAVAGENTIPTVVLVTDGVDDATTGPEDAKAALRDSTAPMYVIGLQAGRLDEGLFGQLATESGGRLFVTADPTDIEARVADLRPDLVELAVATFESSEDVGVQDLEITIGDARLEGSYISGSRLAGAQRLAPRPPVEPGGIAFFQNDLGRLLGLTGAAVACVLFAYGIISLFVREQTDLSRALQPYADGYVAGSEDGEDPAGGQPAILQRAVAFTEQFAERQGFLTRIEHNLEKADLPLRAGEAIFFYAAGIVLVFIVLLVVTQNPLATLVVGGLIALVPPAAVNFLAARKKKLFEGLLPDTLQLLSSTLRAGYSMMQGVEAVSQEVSEPMGKELRRVVTEARLGRPLEESLDAVGERMGSPDFTWAVMAIRIQREVGGNLSELLMTVAETMTQRERLRRDVNSLTAEGRISAYVLIALPIGLGMFLWSVNPDYIGKLFDATLGQIMLGGAIIGIVVGYAWMMKIIKIEI